MTDDTLQDAKPHRSCAGNRLTNNVVGGDPNGAHVLRCGAKTRGARGGRPCRGPAMVNGKCRMHGGLSRGPVTEEGRARAAAANLKHGGHSKEIVEMRAALRRSRAEAEALVAKLMRDAENANTGGQNA